MQPLDDEARAERVAAAKIRTAELATRFVDRTRGELVTMRAALAQLGGGDAAALAEIRHLAHRISGTGATLGFEKLSDKAHAVETLADKLASGAVPDAATFARLDAGVGSIEAELTAIGARPPPA